MLHTEPHDNIEKNRVDIAERRPWYFPRSGAVLMMLIVWGAVVGAGIGVLWSYEHKPGTVHPTLAVWPAESEIPASQSRPTLVLFAHPKCPCTRASIGELARIMAARTGNVRAYAVFVKPLGASHEAAWEKTDLWNSAQQIPGVTAIVDIDGVEAKRFRAETSGFVVLYDHTGKLQFSGGITASRGHSGDNLGRSTIVALLTGGAAQTNNTKAFGCGLATNLGGQEQKCCHH
ncbi:hypothetical protein FF011L_27120 [Roseimaritima multifibrata]|uniref:RedB protein n=1 Tax=Roseimaritima multifibrata TaxID=1930274 RepID=A0A517MGC5_9BACT|nr:hypothetical protein [Roseimaritima multifibrata]QDS93935.1 hypothetical protein FF011L_27120 [Roseimaritima multifibrata]